MPGRPRDSQKTKVFTVEAALRRVVQPRHSDLSNWATTYTKSAWFRHRAYMRDFITVRPTKTAGYCTFTGNQLTLGHPRADELGVLHAFAHVMADQEAQRLGEPKEAWHGRTFARSFLALVQHRYGNDAAKQMRVLYQEHGVKRVAVSEETRQKRQAAWLRRQEAEAKQIWGEWLHEKENETND